MKSNWLPFLLVIAVTTFSKTEEICPDGSNFWPHPDCQFYYECNFGDAPTLKQCPADLYWDVARSFCNLQENVPECVGGTRPPVTTTTTTPPTTTTGPTTTRPTTTTPTTTTTPRPTTTLPTRPTPPPCESRCCLFMYDPVLIPPGPLNVTFNPILKLDEWSRIEELLVVGMSSIARTCLLNAITLTMSFHTVVPSILLTTEFDISGYVDLRPLEFLPSGNFTGEGFAEISLSNLEYTINGTLFINIIGNRPMIRTLSVASVSFTNFYIDLGPDFLIAGTPVDWVELSANSKTRFDQEWPMHRVQFTEKIRTGINELLVPYTLDDLIEFLFGENCPFCSNTP
ncbi:uncharacterized protein LOC110850360 [Folsomia candida]|uniref:Chitin-binding type-2 domain-containing protein n=1 Tax=Folsomia candida TaxID=158441 RepID=A0A226EAH7_FOLCA|nr:uncharacterized protein LOC110850360 [Folsomia candida]OXA54513.1 hypothetical protein Fcan01_10798 [Folsomia candida]